MNMEAITNFLRENWIWLCIAAVAAVIVAVALAGAARKQKKRRRTALNKRNVTISAKSNVVRYASPALDITGHSASILGTREDQQDSFAVVSFLTQQGSKQIGSMLCVVCDGMGGLAAGKEASANCVATFLEFFQQSRRPITDCGPLFTSAVAEADRRTVALAKDLCGDRRAGTTLICAYIEQDRLRWCSVGDSRIYCLRRDKVVCLTQDHNYHLTLCQKVRRGEITQVQADTDAEREALISFIGMDGVSMLDMDSQGIVLKPGDLFVMCSDGLYKALTDTELSDTVLAYREQPSFLAGVLAAKAFDKGLQYQDNTTIIVISCREKGSNN